MHQPFPISGRFFGDRQYTRKVGDLSLTESYYSPGLKLPLHAHSRAYFCVVLRGGYFERYGRRTRECLSPMVVFHPEGEAHSDVFRESGGHVLSAEIGAKWLERLRQLAPVLREPLETRGGDEYTLGLRLFQEFATPDTSSALAVEGLTLQILSAANRMHETSERWRPRWIRTAEAYLRSRFTEEIGLEELARACGVHPSHFARTFRQQFHCTAGDYVRQLRVQEACRRLGECDIHLASLAAELGFYDQSHFCRIFRRHLGCSPMEYRRILLSR